MHFERVLKAKGSLTAETDARPATQQRRNSSKQCMIVFLFRRVFKRVVNWQDKRVFIKEKRAALLCVRRWKKIFDKGRRTKEKDVSMDWTVKKARGFTLHTEMEKIIDKGRRTEEKDVSMDWTVKKARGFTLHTEMEKNI